MRTPNTSPFNRRVAAFVAMNMLAMCLHSPANAAFFDDPRNIPTVVKTIEFDLTIGAPKPPGVSVADTACDDMNKRATESLDGVFKALSSLKNGRPSALMCLAKWKSMSFNIFLSMLSLDGLINIVAEALIGAITTLICKISDSLFDATLGKLNSIISSGMLMLPGLIGDTKFPIVSLGWTDQYGAPAQGTTVINNNTFGQGFSTTPVSTSPTGTSGTSGTPLLPFNGGTTTPNTHPAEPQPIVVLPTNSTGTFANVVGGVTNAVTTAATQTACFFGRCK